MTEETFRTKHPSISAAAKKAWREVFSFIATEKQRLLLEPNKYSNVNVERYSAGLTREVTLGAACDFSMHGSADTNFRIQEICMNAPEPGMFFVKDLRVANISGTIMGQDDAANWRRPRAVDYPTVTPANTIAAIVHYTGRVPAVWKNEQLNMRAVTADGYADLLLAAIRRARAAKTIKQARAALEEAEVLSQSFTLPPPEKFTFSISLSGPASIIA